MQASEIITKVNAFVGPQADRIGWRVGVTNDCRRIFEQYDVTARGQCFRAADWQQARKAVRALIGQGFNGIDTGLPLAEFNLVFLYEIRQSGQFAGTRADVAWRNNDQNAAAPMGATSKRKPSRHKAEEKFVYSIAAILALPTLLIFLLSLSVLSLCYSTATLKTNRLDPAQPGKQRIATTRLLRRPS